MGLARRRLFCPRGVAVLFEDLLLAAVATPFGLLFGGLLLLPLVLAFLGLMLLVVTVTVP